MNAMTLVDIMTRMPGHKVRRLQQISSAIFAEQLAAIDMTAVQLMALVVIRENPGIDATRLSAQIWYDRATIGEVIARLERKGLVMRQPGIRDRRTKQLEITATGNSTIESAMVGLELVQQRLLLPLDADEQALFLGMVDRIIDHADGA